MAIDQKSFRRERVIVWQQHYKDSSCQSVRFFKILGFLDKIFNEKKTILFISNKVYKDIITNDSNSFRREWVIIIAWQQHCKDSSCQLVWFF